MPKALTKQAAASAVVRPSRAPPIGKASRTKVSLDVWKPSSSDWKTSHSLTKPFRKGSPEMAMAPSRKNPAVHGIRRARPPMCSIWRVPQAATTPPAPRKSRPLNRAWFRTWSSDAARASTASAGRPVDERDHPDTGRDEDDADVLDAVVGEQALEVVLHQRVEDPQQHRDRAYRQHEAAPREWRHAQAGHAHAEDPVDPGLDQDPRHQRGDRAGRRGVGLGEPDVEGDHPGLDAEAGQEQQEYSVAEGYSRRSRPENGGERERLPVCGEEEEAGRQATGADVGERQIEEGRPAGLRVLVLGRHQGRGRERHELPGQEETDRPVRHEDHLDRAEEHVEGRAHEGGAPRARVGEVAEAVDGDGDAEDRQDREEEARQGVHRVAQGQSRGFVVDPVASQCGSRAEGEESDGSGHQRGGRGPAERRPPAQARATAQHERGRDAAEARRGGEEQPSPRISGVQRVPLAPPSHSRSW